MLPVLIHGDAAFAGQGVVAETLNLSQLRGYRTGGTVHIVVNNQVGFTTSPQDSRSSVYATDVARMIQAPIFHVNGDDPEAVVRVARLAFEYRQAFKKDVVIDMVCYRRRGHNEADNPSLHPAADVRPDRGQALRPQALHRVADRPRRHHHGRGRGGAARLPAAARAGLHRDQGRGGAARPSRAPCCKPEAGGPPGQPRRPCRPRSPRDVVKQIIDTQVNLPDGFTVHPRLQAAAGAARRDGRARTPSTGRSASCSRSARCCMDGHPVRLVGQDTRRGTFGQRHAVLVDRHTGAGVHAAEAARHRPGARSTSTTRCCPSSRRWASSTATRWPGRTRWCCWEAQFGDFANGAQTIIDEFITSGEQKWGQRSSVVLLLPHGYEGQGPDHSSARIERFLSAVRAGQHDGRACRPRPANYFHLLRWQALSGRHKPLIVFTPKSMLRLKAATSAVERLHHAASFRPLIGDTDVDAGRRPPGAAVHRQGLLRPGRRSRAQAGVTDIAIVAGRAALPAARSRAAAPSWPATPRRRVGHLGAGGAGQPGRLADHGAEAPPGAAAARSAWSRCPPAPRPPTGSAAHHAATHAELVQAAVG